MFLPNCFIAKYYETERAMVLLISKKGTAVVSIVGMLVLVYGTAILYKLFMGNYLLLGSLLDINYLFLALLCALPFVVGSLMVKPQSVLLSVLLFTALFVIVHWGLVFYGQFVTGKGIARMLIVFPSCALLIMIAIGFFNKRNN